MLSVLALFLSAAAASAGTIPINGLVVNKGKEPMVGVTVLLKGTSQGVTTDAEGRFFIDVPDKKSVLSFGFVGYQMQEIVVGSRINLHVILEEQVSELDEVVVVGYGTQRKLSVVGAVEGLAPKDLQIGTNRSLSNNLAGQLSGVIAVQRTGEPGKDNSDFWIRGISTFAGGSTPLVLVDGVERSLNDMDPAEIESFSILKDAAASAVYGVRGANGVILINTKRGEVGPPKVSLRYEVAMSEPTKLPEFVDATTYMEVMNAIASDSRITLPFSQKQIGLTKSRYDTDLYPDVDWIDAITKKHAWNQRVNVNVNGGSPVLRYNVTASVYNERGIMERDDSQSWDGSTKLTRYNVRSNVDVDITKTTLLKINIGGYLQRQNKVNHDIEDLFNVAFNTPPFVHPTIYSNARKDGNQNPWALATQTGYQRLSNSKIESQASLEQNLKFITPGLRARVTFAFDSSNASLVRRGKTPDYYNPATGRDDDGNLIMNIASYGQEFLDHASSGEFGEQTTYLEGAVSYSREFGKHYVDAMLLYNQRSYDTGEKLPYRNQGFAGRFSYSYDRRYVAEFNFGYNGSENFARDHRFGFFPSVAVGWLISEEHFMEPARDVLSKLKLRGSYGIVGNDRINGLRFAYITTLGTNNGYSWGTDGSGGHTTQGNVAHTGRWEGHQGVADLTWEESAKFDIGLELGLWNALNLQADYFFERRSNIFMQRTNIPGSAGFIDSPWANYGIVENRGVDLALEFNKQFGRDWFLSLKGTFTFARNKVKFCNEISYIDNNGRDCPWRYQTGRRVGENFCYIFDHFVADQGEADRLNAMNGGSGFAIWGPVQPGDVVYKDLNGDGVVNNYDRAAIGNPRTPEIQFGIPLGLSYKGFDFSMLWQGSALCSVQLSGPAVWDFPLYDQSRIGKVRRMHLDRWTPETAATAKYPALHYGIHNNNKQQYSSLFLYDASYIRLKNITLGYTIPINKRILEKVRVYVSGENLAYWSPLKRYSKTVDPEVATTSATNDCLYPYSRTFSVGVDITF